MRKKEGLYIGEGPETKYVHRKEREERFHSNGLQIVTQQTTKKDATQKPYHDDAEFIHYHQEHSADQNIGDDDTNHTDTGYESYGVNLEKGKFTIDYSLLEKISRRKLLPSRVIYLQDKKTLGSNRFTLSAKSYEVDREEQNSNRRYIQYWSK